MIHSFLLFSRHGKIRLKKWFRVLPAAEKQKFTQEAMTTVLARKSNMCQVIEYKDKKLVYRRYASLIFCFCIDIDDNELITLELIHRYVTALDGYFGNVCELDIIFQFQTAYHILDELVICGEQVESSAKEIAKILRKVDEIEAESLGLNTLVGQVQHMASNIV
ncbi:AP complex, mu/sigma subunit [Catenaria anguillulae PL171]|uniref:AP complex subunit sigma n=1 Tax=Catenaria anguillulae PL171 TaxID=765915 RepID=A0A1Y2HD21_9FUNG|nr:AP complex, mu/sigma subunit [Catenaria anguillulae PL171]ORZ35519.1 AP complex, mu/sigma subunit [Catenaria anguillulae PL171]